MPKETLSSLDRDAERLLFAGAQVARGDADLEARRQKLAGFAAKAPALAKIVEQVEKAQKAKGKAVAAEVLTLAALMAQVRGAQAAPAAAAGELAPLPPAEPVGSPLSPTELSALVKALTQPGKGRHQVIEDAVERGAFRDLRVLPLCVGAIGDPGVGDLVASDLLPALGHLIVPELRAALRIEKGRAVDARRLGVLAAILKQEAVPLLVEAFEKGSPDVRSQALTDLAELDPVAAEPLALRALASDRSADVRRGAILALGHATSDAALDALIAAFRGADDVRRLRWLASHALARSENPHATDRALALLTPELVALGKLRLPKADTPAKRKANEKLEHEHRAKVSLLSDVLDLVAERKDRPEAVARVLEIYRTHKVEDVRQTAARALLKSGYDKAFEELAPAVIEAEWDTQDEFVEAVLERDPEHAFDRLGRFLDPATLKSRNSLSFAARILESVAGSGDDDEEEPAEGQPAEGKATEAQPAEGQATEGAPEGRRASPLTRDPRWVQAAIALLPRKELWGEALELLGTARSAEAREAVITYVSGLEKTDDVWKLTQVLEGQRDPRVPALLVRVLGLAKDRWERETVLSSLRDLDDPAAVPELRAWLASKKRLDGDEKKAVASLLEYLGRDRAITTGV